MKFEPTYLERSCGFVVVAPPPSFAQYFNEQVAKICFHLHVNKAFLKRLTALIGIRSVSRPNLPRMRTGAALTA